MKKSILLFLSFVWIVSCGSQVAPTGAKTGLEWKAASGNPVNYTIYYSDGVVNYTKTIPASRTSIAFTELKLQKDTNYTFVVKSSNLSGESGSSNKVSYRYK
jgi:hypothetical protein